jgi:DNA invertase Pin-like site-specific DNA recombinase
VRHERLLGYARCSTDNQDLTAQRDGLAALGVAAERIYVDHGLTATNWERPGLPETLAACRAGDTLVVTKLDRLARSPPDARAIADELTVRQVNLNLGGSVYDPTDAVGRLPECGSKRPCSCPRGQTCAKGRSIPDRAEHLS